MKVINIKFIICYLNCKKSKYSSNNLKNYCWVLTGGKSGKFFLKLFNPFFYTLLIFRALVFIVNGKSNKGIVS